MLPLSSRPTTILSTRSFTSGHYNGSAMLRPLVDAAHAVTPLGVVVADAEFDSEHNHRHVRDRLAAVSVIPAKRGKATWQVQGYRAKMQAAFPHQLYRRRALVESLFSAVKRKLSSRAPGRSLQMQRRQWGEHLDWGPVPTATPLERCTISGTEGDDALSGTPRSDVILCFQGAVELSQQFVEPRLIRLRENREPLGDAILVGRDDVLEQPPSLIGKEETVGPTLLNA
jgi:hypothetical protein